MLCAIRVIYLRALRLIQNTTLYAWLHGEKSISLCTRCPYLYFVSNARLHGAPPLSVVARHREINQQRVTKRTNNNKKPRKYWLLILCAIRAIYLRALRLIRNTTLYARLHGEQSISLCTRSLCTRCPYLYFVSNARLHCASPLSVVARHRENKPTASYKANKQQ